ncbi:MAG: hypothetical protein KY397_00510 [Gemmatimonadetes bacterium]|nr:hypothetical protein [Gemmatimonadota bacterium]
MAPGLHSLIERARFLWRERRDMLAGLLDSGSASLATFAVGIYAVRVLDPTLLGGYALAYQATFLVGLVPSNLVFVPVEIRVVAYPRRLRLGHLNRALWLGALPALISALAVVVWVPIAPPEIPAEAIRALTLTGVATAALSPVQDHVRRMLHSGGLSWGAAAVSAVQLVVAAAALGFLHASGIPAIWIPFGALAVANLCSLALGVAWARRGASPLPAGEASYRFMDLARSGSWLLGGGVLNPASGFVAAAIVSRLASAAALGYAEAARVVAQPIWVLAVGLSSVMGPQSMEAAGAGRRARARDARRAFLWPILGVGALTLAWLGPDWTLNPLAWLLPSAYAVEGLVAASIVAQTLAATIFPYRSELLGARKESTFTRIEILGAVARLAVSATASFVRAFAIPLGILAVWAVRWIGVRRALRPVYETDRSESGRAPEAVGRESA